MLSKVASQYTFNNYLIYSPQGFEHIIEKYRKERSIMKDFLAVVSAFLGMLTAFLGAIGIEAGFIISVVFHF